MQEKCGVFGIYHSNRGFDAARMTYFGLFALQHRGQESTGIASSDGEKIQIYKGGGLIAHVYDEEKLSALKGHTAIGHNRYSTSGGADARHTQPIVVRCREGNSFALVHNGNLPYPKRLKNFLEERRIQTDSLNDSEMMAYAIACYLYEGETIENAIRKAYPLFIGAFCLLILTKDVVIALRDKRGIRPLCLGTIDGGMVVASETCALDIVGAVYERDVLPGEMVVVSSSGVKSYQIEEGKQMLDIFEFIYFARPDSVLLGKSVDEVRQNLGRELARERTIQADVVIPIPDSAIPAALGYSRESGIPFYMGIIKNRYVHRTFISPNPHVRKRMVRLKLNVMKHIVSGKDVIVVDDSIIRGTTSAQIVTLIREAGAKKVHLLISSPPVKYPDFYGIDTPAQSELIAAKKSIEEITNFVGADSLQYLSYEGMLKAIGVSEHMLCTSCFTGNYPLDIGEQNAENIDFTV